MDNGLIAIIGSADEGRTYDPPMRDHAKARKMAEVLGRGLAERGFRILVYGPSPNFIEGDTVRGFVQSKKAKPHSIVIEHPFGQEGVTAFPEYSAYRELFEPRQDVSGDWEVSFYSSLSGVNGVVLIGGGQSTLIAGTVALTQGIPLVAFPAFGGKAQEVWERLRVRSLATEEDFVRASAEELKRVRPVSPSPADRRLYNPP